MTNNIQPESAPQRDPLELNAFANRQLDFEVEANRRLERLETEARQYVTRWGLVKYLVGSIYGIVTLLLLIDRLGIINLSISKLGP